MNIYVETNFVLEFVFEQEQQESCEQILTFCEAGKARIFLPAYCLAEPHEKLIRQEKSRKELQRNLDTELRQLARTSSYSTRITSIQDINKLLVQSNEEEKKRFNDCRKRLLDIAEIIPLTLEVLEKSANYEDQYDLSPQDALVYASVITHLHQNNLQKSCFLNKNSKDFDDPDIGFELKQNNCKMIPKFDQGFSYIQALSKPSGANP